MPDLEIFIGGRSFSVSCQEGEEQFLRAAGNMLDAEAQPLLQVMGRMPEAKMLLMAGLMLADKTAVAEEENRILRARVAELEARPDPEPQVLEIAVIPPQVNESLAEIAAVTEALAAQVEELLQGNQAQDDSAPVSETEAALM